MKMFPFMNLIMLVTLITVTSLSVINTTAQTSVKSSFITVDTTRQINTINSFDVQIVTDDSNQKFILAITNPLEEKLRITIVGPEGTGFSDRTKATHYRKRINMGDAQDGNYTVTITGNKKTYSKIIRLNTATVQTRSINME